MPEFELNKWVRDKVFEDMHQLGQQPTYRTLKPEELLEYGLAKVLEEVGEFDPRAPKVDELVDMLEAIETIGNNIGISFEDLRAKQLAKRQRAGGFGGRYFVSRLKLADDDPWVEYYAAMPERFPEVIPDKAES